MSKVSLTRITVKQAEDALRNENDSQLFVLNKSNPTGNINFVINSAGNKVSVQIPVTWIPVDLSMFCLKTDILSDPNFRRVVAKGFLHIVDSQEAEVFMQDEKNQGELNKILDVNNMAEAEGSYVPPIETHVNKVPPIDAGNPFIANIIVRLTGEESEDDLLNELNSKAHTLTPEDLSFLMNNVTSASIKTWCAEELATRPADGGTGAQ